MTEVVRRSTRQRAAVMDVLRDSNQFKTAQEIHDDVRARGGRVGLTTVYRTLQLLVEADEIDVLHVPQRETLYRQCDSDIHHHHLVCKLCRRSVDIEAPDVETWAKGVAGRHGFTATSHVIEVFGVCSACAKS